ncbi:MAG: hypothetical protein H8E57_01820, partial [Candidatus Cloacimonetes bacterium]|nr:hypothetical protein [Candidatus Cloacimonadota bacterium]
MKQTIFILISVLMAIQIFPNGVAIFDAEDGGCLKLTESYVNVVIENQVSLVTATNT